MIRKFVSGGQTGVDRAALDTALERGIACGGWCPKGRRAEDGVIPARYPLQETESADYAERTRLNVLDSDGTLILNAGELAGGTALTAELARLNRKPCRVVQLDETTDTGDVIEWLRKHRIHTLNVAGPREEQHTGIHEQAHRYLLKLLQQPV
jgi:predicted Rossmann fold nucleotide-binding protein DprA/Smf involved in DNA uptake